MGDEENWNQYSSSESDSSRMLSKRCWSLGDDLIKDGGFERRMDVPSTQMLDSTRHSDPIAIQHLCYGDIDIWVTRRHQLEKNKYRDILGLYA
jgi:hypothetical protein